MLRRQMQLFVKMRNLIPCNSILTDNYYRCRVTDNYSVRRPAPFGVGFTLVAVAAVLSGCLGGSLKPREICLKIDAGPSLNLYDGEAHALNLLIYPLTGPAAFEEASVDDLVSGRGVQGAAGAAISVMLSPGESLEVREAFPATTTFVGVVANYYQHGFDNPGNRRVLVEGKCSIFGRDKLTLTARDLLVD